MKKVVSLILVALLVFALSVPAFAARPVEENSLVSAQPSASVVKEKGNKNTLTVTVLETYANGETKEVSATFVIHNNAADTYAVGSYNVFVDTKGNVKVIDCHIVTE